MTTKEIAQAVGKDERTVRRWIEATDKMSEDTVKMSVINSIRERSGSKDSRHPADYTLEETLVIIEAGMGPDAAGIFRANASRSPAGAVSASLIRECRIGYREGVLSRRAIYRLLGLDGLADMDMPVPNQAANLLLEERTKGLAFYQHLAEEAGLVKSDREDLEDTYRRTR
jgi:hypothetical protein